MGYDLREQGLWKGFRVEAQGRHFVILAIPMSTVDRLKHRAWRWDEQEKSGYHTLVTELMLNYVPASRGKLAHSRL